MNRNVLIKHLTNAWQNTVRNQYLSRMINSEHGLQVYLCMALINEFRGFACPRRLFVEPWISVGGGEALMFPDIVVCDSRRIIGVMELKYSPRVTPSHANDLKKLGILASHPSVLNISNERFLGGSKVVKQTYSLADDAVLCWGGIYRARSVIDLQTHAIDSLKPRLFQLHAVTAANQDPAIHVGRPGRKPVPLVL